MKDTRMNLHLFSGYEDEAMESRDELLIDHERELGAMNETETGLLVIASMLAKINESLSIIIDCISE